MKGTRKGNKQKESSGGEVKERECREKERANGKGRRGSVRGQFSSGSVRGQLEGKEHKKKGEAKRNPWLFTTGGVCV